MEFCISESQQENPILVTRLSGVNSHPTRFDSVFDSSCVRQQIMGQQGPREKLKEKKLKKINK
jgi:hypothetical protein